MSVVFLNKVFDSSLGVREIKALIAQDDDQRWSGLKELEVRPGLSPCIEVAMTDLSVDVAPFGTGLIKKCKGVRIWVPGGEENNDHEARMFYKTPEVTDLHDRFDLTVEKTHKTITGLKKLSVDTQTSHKIISRCKNCGFLGESQPAPEYTIPDLSDLEKLLTTTWAGDLHDRVTRFSLQGFSVCARCGVVHAPKGYAKKLGSLRAEIFSNARELEEVFGKLRSLVNKGLTEIYNKYSEDQLLWVVVMAVAV